MSESIFSVGAKSRVRRKKKKREGKMIHFQIVLLAAP